MAGKSVVWQFAAYISSEGRALRSHQRHIDQLSRVRFVRIYKLEKRYENVLLFSVKY